MKNWGHLFLSVQTKNKVCLRLMASNKKSKALEWVFVLMFVSFLSYLLLNAAASCHIPLSDLSGPRQFSNVTFAPLPFTIYSLALTPNFTVHRLVRRFFQVFSCKASMLGNPRQHRSTRTSFSRAARGCRVPWTISAFDLHPLSA
jgi:hypothetical protein